jgi:hypothetical protein
MKAENSFESNAKMSVKMKVDKEFENQHEIKCKFRENKNID